MQDPVDIGMTIHGPLMLRLAQYIKTETELVYIAKMIDVLVGSAQIHAVEHGLDAAPVEYRKVIVEKLQALGYLSAEA